MYFTIDIERKDKLAQKCKTELKNLDRALEIFETIDKEFSYSGNVFNKRFETQLHKFLGDKFGRVKLDRENWRGENTYNNVTCYMHEDISIDGSKRYQVNISYDGFGIGYDHDTKQAVERKQNQKEQFYSIHNADEFAEAIKGAIERTNNYINAVKTAKSKLTSLIKQHNKIASMVNEHNDNVPYILSDELRLK